ncbi:holo-ACP synthase [bacterium]|nr:holo-ACP synthase [candidate division CSSED10-310 bacterium]
MIIGLGLDILDIARLQCMLDRHGGEFKKRVFSDDEIAYCDAKRDPAQHFAARFAAKEAFLKALGCGLRHGIEWLDMEIELDDLGKPTLKIRGVAEKELAKRAVQRIHVSMTHVQQCAAAVVVLESE